MLSKIKAPKKIQLTSAGNHENVKWKKQIRLTRTGQIAILNICFIFTSLIAYSNIVAMIMFT